MNNAICNMLLDLVLVFILSCIVVFLEKYISGALIKGVLLGIIVVNRKWLRFKEFGNE